ncbi:MAG: histone deacetylase [Gemmatimonadota bacterium]|jgi:acetoin utilization deacetylase AcuC-like enzyme
MAEPTALVMHPDCARHDTGWGHPEHQGRLPAVVNALYMDTPALLNVVRQVEAEPASPEALLRVHTGAHVERVRAAVDQAARSGRQVALDPDTIVSDASWDAALAAAGCAITATALVLDGETRTAFAVCRPPGHHATPDRAMGFCLFNNVAVAARWAQAERGVERVLIVDWDVHHGNGTQDIFYEDPSVYFISLHMSPHWPGTGGADEIGAGAGKGTTRNVPLPPGTGPEVYRRALDEALDAALAGFAPELVLISAGFDCLTGDPLGGLCLEPADLHAITRHIIERTHATARGRVVAVLEGGYVPARLGAGVVQVLRALGGLPVKD